MAEGTLFGKGCGCGIFYSSFCSILMFIPDCHYSSKHACKHTKDTHITLCLLDPFLTLLIVLAGL